MKNQSKYTHRVILALGAASALLTGCGGDDNENQALDAPVKIYTLRELDKGGGASSMGLRKLLQDAGAKVSTAECRDAATGENLVWDKDFPEPHLPDDAVTIASASADDIRVKNPPGLPWTYYVFEVRARDVPLAEKLGYRSPLSERASKAPVFKCQEIIG